MSILSIEEMLSLSKHVQIESKVDIWKRAELKAKEYAEKAEEAKQELIIACGNENYEGNGVKVWEIERKGSVDYAAIPELKNVDLEPYRKKGTFYWTVKLSLKK